MPLNLNLQNQNVIITPEFNPQIIVTPDQQPIIVTGHTYYQFSGSGCTQIVTYQTGNIIHGIIYTPCDTGVTQSQFNSYTGATELF